jgi:hypothetical protein
MSDYGKIPSEKERILAKKALRVATEGNKLNRELRESDISVTKVELLVPTSILDHSFSDFMSAGADGLGDAPLGDDTDVDSDWPGL